MPDETVETTDKQAQAANDNAQVAESQQTQTPIAKASAQAAQPDNAPVAESTDETLTVEAARKLRSEHANLRRRLNELETQHNDARAKLTEYEDAKLTEQERLAKQFETLQAQLAEKERVALEYERTLQEQAVQFKVLSAATQLNIVDPEAAYKLLDLSQIEYDEGKPTNVEQVLKALVKAKPYLVQQQAAPPANPTNPSRTDRQAAADPISLPFGQQRVSIWDLGRQGALGGGIVYAGEPGNE